MLSLHEMFNSLDIMLSLHEILNSLDIRSIARKAEKTNFLITMMLVI